MRTSKRSTIGPMFALACASLAPIPLFAKTVRLEGHIFGTTYHIEARSDVTLPSSAVLRRTVETHLGRIDRLMSTWQDESEVSRFNRANAHEWICLSPETAEVLLLAGQLHEKSNGAFDITVAPLVALWNFGNTATEDFRVPSRDQISATLKEVGSQHLEVEINPPRAKKSIERLVLDLSAIAKGYAVDSVSKILIEAGVNDFMVDIGGEVRTRGSNKERGPWRIGIESPTSIARRVDSIVLLRDESMATSGDYRNFFEVDGTRYSHTINPKTGRPVQSDFASVTVFAKTCAEADAYATALMAMGCDAIAWADEQHIDALFLRRDGGTTTVIPSSAFDQSRLVPAPIRPAASPKFGTVLSATAIVFGLATFALAIGVIFGDSSDSHRDH